MKSVLVVPTIREKCIKKFLKEWDFVEKGGFKKDRLEIIVIEDNPTRTFKLSKYITHISWKEIDKDLGKDSWIIPRRTDCIRSYGFLYAYNVYKADYILTLDDDALPFMNTAHSFKKEHLEQLNKKFNRWVQTTVELKSRGIPYYNLGKEKSVMINMGFWRSVADLDAVHQLVYGTRDLTSINHNPVPFGDYFPQCGMNLSFKREILPAMYFLLMGKDWPYDRFGDIWCGIISKKICDHLDYAITTGTPWIKHSRASNVWTNLKKEVPGLEMNETFWEIIDNIKLTGKTVKECYLQIADGLPKDDEYFVSLSRAMKIWIKLLS